VLTHQTPPHVVAWAPRRRRAASIFAPIAQEVRFERFAEAERGIAASVLAGALARRVREARTRGAPQRRGQIAAFDVFNQSVSRRWRGVWEVILHHWRGTDARRVWESSRAFDAKTKITISAAA